MAAETAARKGELKEVTQRGTGANGEFQLRNNGPGFISVEFRDDYVETHVVKQAAPKELSFANILAQAKSGYVIPGHERPSAIPREKNADIKATEKEEANTIRPEQIDSTFVSSTSEKYNPEQPLLSLPKLLSRINANNARHAERDATAIFKHNPYFAEHALAGAPYTLSLCRKCTRDRRCRVHREVYQTQTSVSLCRHTYMNLYWAVNDPVNEKCTWKLEIKTYNLKTENEKRAHEQCDVYRPKERVELLAKRFVEDLRDERVTRAEHSAKIKGHSEIRGLGMLRGSMRRAENEIHALVDAWEAANDRRKRKIERKKAVERVAHEKLAGTLRKVREMDSERKREEENRQKTEKRCEITKTKARPGVELVQYAQIEKREVLDSIGVNAISNKIQYDSHTTIHTFLPTPEFTPITTPSLEYEKSSTPKPIGSSPAAKDLLLSPDIPESIAEQKPLPTSPSNIEGYLYQNPQLSIVSSDLLFDLLPSPPGNERKRSLDSEGDNNTSLHSRKIKKVSFTPEIEAARIVEKPRLRSLPYESDVEGEAVEGKVAGIEKMARVEETVVNSKSAVNTDTLTSSSYYMEDEVDYDDNELE